MILRQIVSEAEGGDWTGAAADLISAAIGRRFFILKTEGDVLLLPVTPWKYSVTTGQLNKTYDVLDAGEVLVFGNVKLQKLKFSCFFPATHHRYPFVTNIIDPKICVETLLKWKDAKTPVRVIITDSPVNLVMAIQNFDYKERDGTRDIDYTLNLSEYRDLNVPAANNPRVIDDRTGLRGRPDEEPSRYKMPDWTERNSQDRVDLYKFTTGNCFGFAG